MEQSDLNEKQIKSGMLELVCPAGHPDARVKFKPVQFKISDRIYFEVNVASGEHGWEPVLALSCPKCGVIFIPNESTLNFMAKPTEAEQSYQMTLNLD